jgi:CHRD domain-containing protein
VGQPPSRPPRPHRRRLRRLPTRSPCRCRPRATPETGTATLTSVDATKTKVTLQLENAPAGPQPAHIHTGNCPKPGAVKYPLTNVEKGTSETTVAASLDDLLAGVFAINVHKSPGEGHVYVSCGDIRR